MLLYTRTTEQRGPRNAVKRRSWRRSLGAVAAWQSGRFSDAAVATVQAQSQAEVQSLATGVNRLNMERYVRLK